MFPNSYLIIDTYLLDVFFFYPYLFFGGGGKFLSIVANFIILSYKFGFCFFCTYSTQMWFAYHVIIYSRDVHVNSCEISDLSTCK